MFFSVNIPDVNTEIATAITETSAQLNGNVRDNGFPAAIKFDYGFTLLYGNEVDAVPDSVMGVSNINASYALSGVTLGNTYHYRIKAININGTSYGEDMIFVAGAPSVVAGLPSDIKINSARVSGIVNANNATAVNKFEYGLSTFYGNEVTAIPDSSTGNSDVSIACLLSGLTPNTLYHYRVKATNVRGTNYSSDMMFSTLIPPYVKTLPATEITSGSAQLNGTVNAGGVPTAIKMEYGLTSAYGNEINAIPDSSSSIDSVNVYAPLTNLIPNTTYHYRVKGTNSDTTQFGEDMFLYTGYSEIPNFDFESWTPFTLPKPIGYDMTFGKISQTTDACDGTYAVKIKNDSIPLSAGGQPGAIVIGFTYDQGQTFTGGIPFNARPDSILGCFNYDIGGGDSAILFIELKKQGVPISVHIYGIPGSSGGDFKELKFAIPYTSSGNADSLIWGIASTDIFHMSQNLPNSYIIADNIRFTGTTLNIPNNSFENWNTNTHYALDGWAYTNKFIVDPFHSESFAIDRTTDAVHGNYALLLQNYIYPTDTLMGKISINSQILEPGFGVTGRHLSLTGYYKYFPENDTMNIKVTMFKNHVAVGYGTFRNFAEVANYTPLAINILYLNDSIVPDSCQIFITIVGHTIPHGNSKLYIDNLNFDGFFAGIKEPAITDAVNMNFNIYPNPFNEQATVAFTIKQDEKVMVRLFDLSGKLVALLADGKYTAGSHLINLSAQGLQKGFYICVINTENAFYSKKLIVF